jgi:hypothetical protein
MRYDDAPDRWALYRADCNGRWHIFVDINPVPVSELLKDIELDNSGIFWG